MADAEEKAPEAEAHHEEAPAEGAEGAAEEAKAEEAPAEGDGEKKEGAEEEAAAPKEEEEKKEEVRDESSAWQLSRRSRWQAVLRGAEMPGRQHLTNGHRRSWLQEEKKEEEEKGDKEGDEAKGAESYSLQTVLLCV